MSSPALMTPTLNMFFSRPSAMFGQSSANQESAVASAPAQKVSAEGADNASENVKNLLRRHAMLVASLYHYRDALDTNSLRGNEPVVSLSKWHGPALTSDQIQELTNRFLPGMAPSADSADTQAASLNSVLSQLNVSERDTVYASLRYMQQSIHVNGGFPPESVMKIASAHGRPLRLWEIDNVCAELTRSMVTVPKPVIEVSFTAPTVTFAKSRP